jgi:hypothetical protein
MHAVSLTREYSLQQQPDAHMVQGALFGLGTPKPTKTGTPRRQQHRNKFALTHVDGSECVEFSAQNQVDSAEWVHAIGRALFSVPVPASRAKVASTQRDLDDGQGNNEGVKGADVATASYGAAAAVAVRNHANTLGNSAAMAAFDRHFAEARTGQTFNAAKPMRPMRPVAPQQKRNVEGE